MSKVAAAPDLMPQLMAGKHRSPRNGACFMEFASYLAGERWSDHPACTHPLVAFLARGVNDFSSDEGRARLVPLIPRVVGLTSDDPRMDVTVALRAATCAIPVAAESRQRALAAGILSCERALTALEGSPNPHAAALIARAAAQAPDAWHWARVFSSQRGLALGALSFTRAGRAIVSTSVLGIAQACVSDMDDRLHDVLSSVIDDCRELARLEDATPASVPARDAVTFPLFARAGA